MNAFQPSRPPLQPVPRRQPARKRNNRRHPYRGVAVQTTAKLAVYIVLSTAAVSAIVKLLPYNWSQQQKLQEIQTEVNSAAERFDSLQTNFSHNFDPQASRDVMKQQSNRLEPGQRKVIWLDKSVK